jgi:hypothetical protein
VVHPVQRMQRKRKALDDQSGGEEAHGQGPS